MDVGVGVCGYLCMHLSVLVCEFGRVGMHVSMLHFLGGGGV